MLLSLISTGRIRPKHLNTIPDYTPHLTIFKWIHPYNNLTKTARANQVFPLLSAFFSEDAAGRMMRTVIRDAHIAIESEIG